MEFYLNSCSLEEIKEVYGWGILDGVTMNPALVAAQGGDFVKNFEAICRAVPVKVFAQVVSENTSDIVQEAQRLHSLGGNVVVKIHTTIEGVRAMRMLKDTTDVPTCATGVHTVMEALSVAKAGADHIALFLGLLGEADERSTDDLVRGTVEALSHTELPARVMSAARSLNQIVETFRCGAHEMTCSYKLWQLFFANSYTHDRWVSFSGHWNKVYAGRNWITG